MAKFVIKNDGTKEPFDEEKLRGSIRVNALEATLAETEEKIKNLVEQVSGTIMQQIENKEEIPTKELREKILQELETTAPNVAEIWKKYDKMRGRT